MIPRSGLAPGVENRHQVQVARVEVDELGSSGRAGAFVHLIGRLIHPERVQSHSTPPEREVLATFLPGTSPFGRFPGGVIPGEVPTAPGRELPTRRPVLDSTVALDQEDRLAS